jgi:hypothetical protein
MWAAWAAVVALGLGLWGAVSCSEPNPDAYTGATTRVRNPHPENYAQPAVHGAEVFAAGLGRCRGCHGDDFKGGLAGLSCFGCHPLYPHADNFAEAGRHGQQYLADDGRETCATLCHGADLQGGDSGVSCFRCHARFPHSDDWSRILVHGVYTDQNGGPNALCAGCHGADFAGGNAGVSCSSCHPLYPHGWPSGGHGTYVLQHGTAGCQTQCHGSDLTGGVSGVNCFDCHDDLDDDKSQ